MRLLERSGYQPVGVANAAEARQIFEEQEGGFDLLFSDVVMPGQSGFQLAEDLVVGRPGLCVLLSSGYAEHGRLGDYL